jgi:branched-chain amino acid transport system permease protein
VQLFLNGVAYFSAIFLFSTAFFFHYRAFRFFDLSLGAIFLAGAYPYEAAVQIGGSEVLGILLAGFVGATVSVVFIELLVRPLARFGASALDLTLCALGVYIIGVNIIALIFGDEIRRPSGIKSISVAGASVSSAQISLISLALASFIAIVAVLRFTSVGRVFRALSDNPNLARDLGLPIRPAIILTTATGAALVGMGGALLTADVGVKPTSGFSFILPGLAAVLAFGGRNVSQVLFGAAIVAVTGEWGALLFGQQWRELSIFLVLLALLASRARLIRPVLS